MSRRSHASKSGAAPSTLLSRHTAVEKAIRENSEETIEAIKLQIKTRDEEGESELLYPLPCDFVRDAGADSEAMRKMVWGKVLEYFSENYSAEDITFQVVPQPGNSWELLIRWKRAIDPQKVAYYSDLINKFSRPPAGAGGDR